MFPVSAFRITLEKIVGLFVRNAIRFHITGGITSMAYGEPRMTQDVDFVVDRLGLTKALNSFKDSLEESRYLFDPASIKRAIDTQGMFQLFDLDEALKIDIYAREMIPGELDRSELIEIFDQFHVPIVSRVDAALSKLIWVSKGSHKSRRDFRQMMRLVDADQRAKILQQIGSLQLESVYEQVMHETDEIDS